MLWISGWSTTWCDGWWHGTHPVSSVTCTRIRWLASYVTTVEHWAQNGQHYIRGGCTLLLVCDSVLQLCDHTYVHAELRSQSMVIMDYLIATAQDDIHATIKSTRYCVVYLPLPVLMQLESHIRSVVAMTRDQMEQLRFPGRVAWLRTPPAPTQLGYSL